MSDQQNDYVISELEKSTIAECIMSLNAKINDLHLLRDEKLIHEDWLNELVSLLVETKFKMMILERYGPHFWRNYK